MPKVVMKRDASSSSSSDSDSGPDDRTPAKKAKTDASGAASSSAATDEDGNKYWELDKKKRASVRSYKGKSYVDLRDFYEKDGKTLPSKKGITLPMSQWLKLLETADEITKELESK